MRPRSLPVDVAHAEVFDFEEFLDVVFRTFAADAEQESAPLLSWLYQHAVRPEFTCRFRWRANSIAFWDNRCVQHNAINDYQGQRRVMHRVTIEGERPV